MDRATYCNRQIWHATAFELGLEYHSGAGDELFWRAAETLWRYPGLAGPWRSPEEYGRAIEISPEMLPRDSMLSLYGLLRLRDGREAACSVFILRPNGEPDSLSLCLPGGMLERLFPVSYDSLSVKTKL